MSAPATVSVVIPCFNDGRYLHETLASIRTQTLQPVEILVVNDGSTDPTTIKLLQKIEMPGLRVIHQENRGPSAARNTGIRNSQSKYVYFLDADNILLPECLATLGALLEEDKTAIAAYSRIQFINGPQQGQEWGESYNPYCLLVQNQWDAGILLRKETIEKNDLWYDESMRQGYEDWEYHIRLAKTGKPILFCPIALYRYRVRRNSRSVSANSHYAEIVGQIRSKHPDLFDERALLTLKRSYVPAVGIESPREEQAKLKSLLRRHTFCDWVFACNLQDSIQPRYQLFHAGTNALERLPKEAIEAAVMSLECNQQLNHAVIAVKEGRRSWLAAGGEWGGSTDASRPVALLVKRQPKPAKREKIIQEALCNFEMLLEFPDQAPQSESAWSPALVQFNRKLDPIRGRPIPLRKNLSRLAKETLGPILHRRGVSVYDTFYGILVSDKSLSLRKSLRSILGQRAEEILSRLFYGLFLANPPSAEEATSWKYKKSSVESIPPFFVHPVVKDKIKLLIATAWLTEGGVDQIVLDLCRFLDPARFQVTLVTTLPSSHPWDHWARKAGVSVYHLADFLKPDALSNGLVHLALNLKVDCLHIIHSKVAYESARKLKSLAPWISISDRNEVLDPGGGFPRVTAKVGKEFIDVRTVSYKKLADYMYENYELSQGSLRVIYTGASLDRINKAFYDRHGLLEQHCNVNQGTPVVIFVGRFAEQKRPEKFVRSVAKIFDMRPECTAHFAMVGDGHLLPSVRTLISKLKLEKRIHLLGPHSNAVELMADATVLMMPSAYEGLALVSYEAMALGIPQIFANVGGQSELITPETGILIDNGPGEETRYAQACLELLSDPGQRARMAAAGKERIRAHFAAEYAVKQYAEIFEELAALSRKRASEIPHLTPPHINPLYELA